MDKEALEALQRFKHQGIVEQLGLSITVNAFIFRKWWVDETKPDRIRWFFLDGTSQDAHGTPFWVRAWWAIPLDDLAFFEELDQIPLNSILNLNSVSCTMASAEDFYLEDKEIPEQEGNPKYSIELKEPSRR